MAAWVLARIVLLALPTAWASVFPSEQWIAWYRYSGNGSRLLKAEASLTIPLLPSLP